MLILGRKQQNSVKQIFFSLKKEYWTSKEQFHARIGTIKDRNGRDLTEAKEVKKRWQEYARRTIQEKVLMNQITTVCGYLSWSVKSSGP